jgi:hypothetical protein
VWFLGGTDEDDSWAHVVVSSEKIGGRVAALVSGLIGALLRDSQRRSLAALRQVRKPTVVI